MTSPQDSTPTPLSTRCRNVSTARMRLAEVSALQQTSNLDLARNENAVYYALCFQYPFIKPDLVLFQRRGLRCFNAADIKRAIDRMDVDVRRRFVTVMEQHRDCVHRKREMDSLRVVAEVRLRAAVAEEAAERARIPEKDFTGVEVPVPVSRMLRKRRLIKRVSSSNIRD